MEKETALVIADSSLSNLKEYTQPTFQCQISVVSTLQINVEITLTRY